METVVGPSEPKLGEAINLLCQLENRLDAMRSAPSNFEKMEAVQFILLDLLEFSNARFSDDALANSTEQVRCIVEQTKSVDSSLWKSRSTVRRLFGRTAPGSEVAKSYEELRHVYVAFIGEYFASLTGSLGGDATQQQALLEGAESFIDELTRVW